MKSKKSTTSELNFPAGHHISLFNIYNISFDQNKKMSEKFSCGLLLMESK